MKKMVLLCVVLLSVFAIVSISNATVANPGWYNASVQSVGALPSSNFYFIFATDLGSPTTWTGSQVFLLDASNPENKAALASALTGFANSTGVALYLPSGTAVGTFISGVGAGTVQ
jgi:hypothetical protein